MSTPKFHTLRIKNIQQETADCVTVSMHIPAELQNEYQYTSGQYLTFKKEIAGEELRRSYSISTAPHEGEWRVAIKKIDNGKFSTFANTQLKVGDVIEVMTPMGNFCASQTQNNKNNYLAIASGSGITPIISIIKNILHSNQLATITLVYGNKNVLSIIFKEEIEALKNTYLHRLQVVHILSREQLESDLNYGRITKEKCALLFEKLIDVNSLSECFLCGPEEMVLSIKDFLLEKGLDSHSIKYELFGTNNLPPVVTKVKNTNASTTSKVFVKVDDRTIEMDLANDGESILDAALRHGADLPFACKGGVCCTCRAKITEGTATMDVNYALEPEEVAQGFILTCQAHPTSEKLVVDFDVR